MPEPYPHPASDDRVSPADGSTSLVANPKVSKVDEPIVEPSAAPALPSARYQLLDEIAHGGMGVIWRATDTALSREVAIKVLQDKYALDSDVARRFAHEARITAQLPHPAIPPVHDIGTLPDGRPFLAMKFIKGQTLDKLLRARPDVASERGRFVAVFEQVCQAVAYAHAHGVLHRDLKPANVMVGAFGEVQLMDWGLAKVLGDRPVEAAAPEETRPGTQVVSLRESDELFTQAGSILGTPSYMPPEQAIGAVDQIDTRSDVFGLGGILAVILTGQPPFVGDSSESTRQLAAKGKVQDCFARLDACGADPELIAMCKHCLAPEKEDRPADGGAVARAVAALRAAADERARRAELDKVRVEGEKAAAEARALERRKRRRLWLGAAAALVLAVVGGLSAVLAVQRRANADLAAKNDELAQEKDKVQARFELAQKAIATFHTGVSEDVLLKNKQFAELRTRLLKEAAGFYGDLEKLLEGQTDAKSRRLLAEGYFQLGELTNKIGSKPGALKVHQKALAIRRELAAAPDADVPTRLDVARGRGEVGWLRFETGDPAGARVALEEQRDIAAALEAESPTEPVREVLARSHNVLGHVLRRTGKPGEALGSYQKAVAIWQQLADTNPASDEFQSSLATDNGNIGLVLFETGKPDEALKALEAARDIVQKLSGANPTVIKFQTLLGSQYDTIGWVLLHMGKVAEALAAYEKTREIRQKLVEANPAVTEFQEHLARSHNNIGYQLLQLGKTAEALSAVEKALEAKQKIAGANPTVPEFQSSLARSHVLIGSALSQLGKPAEALTAYEKALAVMQKVADANPSVTQFQMDLASSFFVIGILRQQAGKSAEALAAHDRALMIWQRLAEANPAILSYQGNLGSGCNERGRVLAKIGRFPDALTSLEQGRAILEKLVRSHPSVAAYKIGLGQNHAYRGWALRKTGRSAEAAAELRQAIALWDESKDLESDMRFERARALALLAGLGSDAKSGITAAEAARFAERAVTTLHDAVQSGWTKPEQLKESDFDSLRKRADFQTLVQDLEAKAAAARRTSPDNRSQKEKE